MQLTIDFDYPPITKDEEKYIRFIPYNLYNDIWVCYSRDIRFALLGDRINFRKPNHRFTFMLDKENLKEQPNKYEMTNFSLISNKIVFGGNIEKLVHMKEFYGVHETVSGKVIFIKYIN